MKKTQGTDGLWAHSANDRGYPQLLFDHLTAVAALSATYAAKWGARSWGWRAGLYHDVGKSSARFQSYVRSCTTRGGQHSITGAACGAQEHPVLAFPIAGHHGGLPDRSELRQKLQELPESSLERACTWIHSLLKQEHAFDGLHPIETPDYLNQRDPLPTEFFIRMLFSALVDADFLDTEAHFNLERFSRRNDIGQPTVGELWDQFERNQRELMSRSADSPMNRLRRDLYGAVLDRADDTPGFFTLTAPTGSGKTRTALGFALKHAMIHGLTRVIFVIPYTSIIEQTAALFRDIFVPTTAVLEHHSSFDETTRDNETREFHELASENWDVPIVVTTVVQFFESLLGNRPSKLRKIHRIARSVVVLDEVQLLPVEKLAVLYNVMQELTRNYGTTFLLTTATQPPVLASNNRTSGSPATELVPNMHELFERLSRVRYVIPIDDDIPATMTWDDMAEWMLNRPSALAVVNTRRDAAELFTRIRGTPGAFHLSTSLCGAHRLQVLGAVKQRLAAGEPCRLVSTQLIEAGVDVDFGAVARALGPLVSIVQAAGRCNREGKLEYGEVLVVVPEEGGMPPGPYRTGTDTSRVFLRSNPVLNLGDPTIFRQYFERLYQTVDLDREGFQQLRQAFDYRTLASRFKIIDQTTVPVLVPWDGLGKSIVALRAGKPPTRELMRSLQPYVVTLYEEEFKRAHAMGQCEEVCNGVWLWNGLYDRELGVQLESPREGLPIL